MDGLLGHKVRDRITGLEGIVTSRTEYLNGCVRYAVQPPVDQDGKVRDSMWADESDLLDQGAVVTPMATRITEQQPIAAPPIRRTGGDRPPGAPAR